MDAHAFWTTAPGQGEIRSETLPTPAADEVVVRALYSGISRGTEALVFHGRVPVTEYQRMRAPFQAGAFPGPVKYGYASAGQVEQGPHDLVGRHVFALYPHQSRYVVPVDAVHLLPEDVPPRRAVLAANMETAINGVWDAGLQPGDRIAVVGAGTVGCLVAWLAGRVPGSSVELIDVNPHRAVTARAMGVGFASPDRAATSADVVIHASGAPAGLETAMRLAGLEATIVDLSWYGDQLVPLTLGGAFHAQRLTIKSSQVGRVPLAQRARWSARRRLQLALSLLADPAFDILITGESAFETLPDVMTRVAGTPGDTLCHCIRYA